MSPFLNLSIPFCASFIFLWDSFNCFIKFGPKNSFKKSKLNCSFEGSSKSNNGITPCNSSFNSFVPFAASFSPFLKSFKLSIKVSKALFAFDVSDTNGFSELYQLSCSVVITEISSLASFTLSA